MAWWVLIGGLLNFVGRDKEEEMRRFKTKAKIGLSGCSVPMVQCVEYGLSTCIGGLLSQVRFQGHAQDDWRRRKIKSTRQAESHQHTHFVRLQTSDDAFKWRTISHGPMKPRRVFLVRLLVKNIPILLVNERFVQ